MREILTSGSTRGEWAASSGSPSLLLYRLSSFYNILKMLFPIYEPLKGVSAGRWVTRSGPPRSDRTIRRSRDMRRIILLGST